MEFRIAHPADFPTLSAPFLLRLPPSLAAPRRPEHLRWFWSFAIQGPMIRSNRVATFEEPKAQFQKSWEAWKAWAKMEEMDDPT